MSLYFNLFMSFFHFAITYVFFITILFTNNVKILFILLVIMSVIKYLYYFLGRCVLTLYEYNDYFSTMAELFSKTLTNNNLGDKITEEVLINVGILMILNKLILLIIYNYYYKKIKFLRN
jgi:hypothetical protein